MALTNNEKQEALRIRRRKLGLSRKEFWLSETEFTAVKKYLKRMRVKPSNLK